MTPISLPELDRRRAEDSPVEAARGPVPVRRRRRRTLVSAALVVLLVVVATVLLARAADDAGSRSEAVTQTAASATPGDPAASAPAQEPLDSSFGRADSTTAKGEAEGSVPVPAGMRAGVALVTHTGAGAFSVSVEPNNGLSAETLFTGDGDVRGELAFGLPTAVADGAKLVVRSAGGSWEVVIAPLSAAASLSDRTAGTGNRVLRVDGPATLTIEQQGLGSIAVLWATPTESEMLLVETGDVSQTVHLGPGTGLLAVRAAGDWLITRQ